MTKKTLGIVLFTLLFQVSGFADTRTGNANLTSVQLWKVTPVGDGQLLITLSWGNAGADLAMVVVCGAEPFILPWGSALGGLNGMAALNVGVLSDVPCLVGVSSLRRRSGYRIHFQHAVSQSSRGRGREPLQTTTTPGVKGSVMAAALEREMQQLKRLAVLR